MDFQDHEMHQEQPTSSEELPSTLASHSIGDSSLTKKGTPWSVDEHFQFLRGLERLGRGNWRGISRFFVHTRTPTQVASHAQKHFLRVGGNTKRRSRFAAIEEEVYGGAPPAKMAVLATASDMQYQHPTPALPPRAPHPPSSTGARPGALGTAGSGRTSLPSQPHLSGPQQHPPPAVAHSLSSSRPSREVVSEAGTRAVPSASIWANPHAYLSGPSGRSRSMHAHAHSDTAWLNPLWAPGTRQPMAKATPTTTNSGSSGQHQHTTTLSGNMAVQRKPEVPAAGVPVSEAAAHSMSTANGPAMVPGYPTGAFFSMPAFMHPSMNPMMAYAMQAAGAAAEHAHSAPQPTAVFSAAAQQPPAASTRSPSSSSSSQLEPAQAPPTAMDTHQLSVDNSQSSGAGRRSPKRAAPCKPEATVASWQPGCSTPASVTPLLAQLQLAGAGAGLGSAQLQLMPSRSSAFTALAPAIRA